MLPLLNCPVIGKNHIQPLQLRQPFHRQHLTPTARNPRVFGHEHRHHYCRLFALTQRNRLLTIDKVQPEKALPIVEIIRYLLMNKPAHPILVAPAVAVVVHHLASAEPIPVILLPKVTMRAR